MTRQGGVGTLSPGVGSLDLSAESANEKSTLTMPVNVPIRAGDEIRTRDVQLGKLAFYR